MTPPDPCQAIRDDLVAHLDGELEAARGAEVAAHLATCAACAAERDALARTWKHLDLLAVPAAVDAAWLDGIAGKILAEADAAQPASLRVLPGSGSGSGAARAGSGRLVTPRPDQVARPAAASASRRLAIAAAALLAAGLAWAALHGPGRLPQNVADRPLQPDHPAPRDPGPLPSPTPVPSTTKTPPAMSEHPSVKDPLHQSTTPQRAAPATPLRDPLEGMPQDEVALVSNLDLLEDLAELEDLQTIEALDALDDLAPEELNDEG